jgi:hypothetical protein
VTLRFGSSKLLPRATVGWQLIPAKVRWFGKRGFGVAFDDLDVAQTRAPEAFVFEVQGASLV